MMRHREIAAGVMDHRCSRFARLLKQPRQLAEGVSVMHCSSWDRVCALASLKVCNKCTNNTRLQGFFVLVWE